MSLDDTELVAREYADESRFAARRAAWRDLREGPNAWDEALAHVVRLAPARVLEVGCGEGDFAARVALETGAEVVALDVSPRMVEIARGRGVDARTGDVQALPFADASFECAVANWMLYHVPDLDRGLGELARVLTGDGHLVAATQSLRQLPELWRLLPRGEPPRLGFTGENGAERLAHHFGTVEPHDLDVTITFPDHDRARAYVAASITRRHLADRLPPFDGPLRCTARQTIFVAAQPLR